MHKIVTGAIAGAAGVALLLGGAGSFALWNASASSAASAVSAGTLSLTANNDGVMKISEVQGMEGETVTLQDAFLFDYSAGVDASGTFLGKPVPTGVRPRFTDRFQELGISLSPQVFGMAEHAATRGWG